MTARQRAEATKTTPATKTAAVTVTWRDTTYTLPTADDFPFEAMEASEEGRTITALKLILGQAQYAEWRKHVKTAGDVEEFSETIMRELGPGNR
ncbi:hypothetical protein [Kutzneria sp. NPDC052558]|uniref:hypothetical protein n=1 Tax=Kutzneria sp. NPDC052558 TaxID=3364121 RepID=UPI0037C8BBB4